MRSPQDYRHLVYTPRQRKTDRTTTIVVALLMIALCLGAFRLDYLAQRDCNGNAECLAAVMP